jgi:transposase
MRRLIGSSMRRLVIESWAGKTPNEIATELDCHPQTVRIHLARFNAEGIPGLGMRAGSGRKPRLSEQERSRILSLVKQPPPGRLERRADETMVARDEQGSAQWSLDALAQAAKEAGIGVKRSQIRRIYVREGVRWRQTHSWGTSHDPDFVCNPDGGRLPLHAATRGVDDGSRTDDTLASSAPHLSASPRLVPHWAPHQSAAGLQPRSRENLGVWSWCHVRDGKEVTRCAASRNSTNYIALLADIEADNPTGDIFMITDNREPP